MRLIDTEASLQWAAAYNCRLCVKHGDKVMLTGEIYSKTRRSSLFIGDFDLNLRQKFLGTGGVAVIYVINFKGRALDF